MIREWDYTIVCDACTSAYLLGDLEEPDVAYLHVRRAHYMCDSAGKIRVCMRGLVPGHYIIRKWSDLVINREIHEDPRALRGESPVA